MHSYCFPLGNDHTCAYSSPNPSEGLLCNLSSTHKHGKLLKVPYSRQSLIIKKNIKIYSFLSLKLNRSIPRVQLNRIFGWSFVMQLYFYLCVCADVHMKWGSCGGQRTISGVSSHCPPCFRHDLLLLTPVCTRLVGPQLSKALSHLPI